jgi:putative membrane protein
VREPGVEDATRRTRLANERTYLAWWRTGLTTLAVAVGVGRVAPEVSHSEKWPYEIAGTGFGLLGIVFLIVGYLRTRTVEEALDRGEFVPFGRSLALGLLLAGLALGAVTVVLVAVAR